MLKRKEGISKEESLKKACEENELMYVPNAGATTEEIANAALILSKAMLNKSNDIVDFTDDEFRGMLGYILGYTSEDISDDYKKLRNALVNEVLLTTGKDLKKCWIWM